MSLPHTLLIWMFLYLESIGMFVARPHTRLRTEEKAFFIALTNVVVQVLGKSKLSVELLKETKQHN